MDWYKNALGMEATLTRKPVKTSEKSRRKFMANDAWPAVLEATAGARRVGQAGGSEESEERAGDWWAALAL